MEPQKPFFCCETLAPELELAFLDALELHPLHPQSFGEQDALGMILLEKLSLIKFITASINNLYLLALITFTFSGYAICFNIEFQTITFLSASICVSKQFVNNTGH